MAKSKNANAGSIDPSSAGENIEAGSANTGADSIGGISVSDPIDASGGSADTGNAGDKPARGRGRPAGSGSKPKTKTAPSVSGIEKILLGIHLGLAKMTGVDELVIDKEEAGALSAAVVDIASFYDVAPDPKMMAWFAFAAALGGVYGPRIASYKLRSKIEKEMKKAPAYSAPAHAAKETVAAAMAVIADPLAGISMPANL